MDCNRQIMNEHLPSITKVLLIEDSDLQALAIKAFLRDQKIDLKWKTKADHCMDYLADNPVDIIICDIQLPGVLNGLDLCQLVKQKYPNTQVLLLSALNSVEDKIKGLNLGADDYLAKPFNDEELIARFQVLHRRVKHWQQHLSPPADVCTRLLGSDLRIDLKTRDVFFDGQKIKLRRREFDLLVYLMKNAEKVSLREDILAQVWGDEEISNRTVDTHIQRLRQLLSDKGPDYRYIETLRGIGYRFLSPVQSLNEHL